MILTYSISATSTESYAAAQRDRDAWLKSRARLEWLSKEGIVQ